jgi:uncharacterized protein YbjT (DUF2867 family)
MGIKVIITGATGMVGEGVMHECLSHPQVNEVLLLSRKSSGIVHPKVKEVIHHDLYNISPVKGALAGYDACYFCLGVSSVGMNEADYTKVSYDLTMHIAGVLSSLNPQMTFCYISGAGTDSTEKGRSMWARVKGRTENALQRLPFKAVYLFRPGYLQPTKGLKNTLGFYKYVSWLYPVLQPVFPGMLGSLRELGRAMISVTLHGYSSKILGVKDIRNAALKA